jgi:hypothetical protein
VPFGTFSDSKKFQCRQPDERPVALGSLGGWEINFHNQQFCETPKGRSAPKSALEPNGSRQHDPTRYLRVRDASQSRKWLFLAAVRNAARGWRDVINLAATDDFLDLTWRAASVIDEGQGAVARFVLENLCMGRAGRKQQDSRHD